MTTTAPPLPDDEFPQLQLTVEAARRINFASAQNAVPILRAISVTNSSDTAVATGVSITLRAHPGFCREKSWTLDRIAAGDTVTITDRHLDFDLPRLSGIDEAEHGEIRFTLNASTAAPSQQSVPVELLARDEWGGLADMAQILAAFVSPNDPAIPALLKSASRLLEAGWVSRTPPRLARSRSPARRYVPPAASSTRGSRPVSTRCCCAARRSRRPD